MNVSKTNGVKLLAAVMVLTMVFAGAAVVMSDDGVDAASSTVNGTTYLSGDVTATQQFGVGTNVVVNDDLSIPAGMALIINGGKLTVDAGATITIAAGGQLILLGASTVTINGNIVAEGTITSSYLGVKDTAGNLVNAVYYGAIVNNTVNDGTTGVFLNGNITLQRGAELWTVSNYLDLGESGPQKPGEANSADANVIQLPCTITVPEDANGQIVVGANGSIDITQRSRSVSVIGNQDIILNVGATFNFNGNVVDDVVIKALGSGAFYTAGAATISNTENTYADASSSDLTFTVSVQNRQALTNSADEDSNITLRQYILNIEGNVDNNQELAIEGGESNKVDNKKTSPQEYFETTGYPYVVFPLVTVTGNLEVAASSDFSIETPRGSSSTVDPSPSSPTSATSMTDSSFPIHPVPVYTDRCIWTRVPRAGTPA